MHPGQIATRMREALDQVELNRITCDREHDRDGAVLRGERRGRAHSNDHSDLETGKIVDHLFETGAITGEAGLDLDALPFDVSQFSESFAELHWRGPRRRDDLVRPQ